MKLICHMVQSDIRRLGGGITGWMLVVAISAVLHSFAAPLAPIAGGVDALDHAAGFLRVVSELGLALCTGLMVVADPLNGPRAHWRTRPVGRGRLFTAKLSSVLAVTLGGVAVTLLVAWCAGESPIAAIERLEFPALRLAAIAVIGAVVGALSEDRRGFVVRLGSLVVGAAVLAVGWVIASGRPGGAGAEIESGVVWAHDHLFAVGAMGAGAASLGLALRYAWPKSSGLAGVALLIATVLSVAIA